MWFRYDYLCLPPPPPELPPPELPPPEFPPERDGEEDPDPDDREGEENPAPDERDGVEYERDGALYPRLPPDGVEYILPLLPLFEGETYLLPVEPWLLFPLRLELSLTPVGRPCCVRGLMYSWLDLGCL